MTHAHVKTVMTGVLLTQMMIIMMDLIWVAAKQAKKQIAVSCIHVKTVITRVFLLSD